MIAPCRPAWHFALFRLLKSYRNDEPTKRRYFPGGFPSGLADLPGIKAGVTLVLAGVRRLLLRRSEFLNLRTPHDTRSLRCRASACSTDGAPLGLRLGLEVCG
jgi:hypothetical protein